MTPTKQNNQSVSYEAIKAVRKMIGESIHTAWTTDEVLAILDGLLITDRRHGSA